MKKVWMNGVFTCIFVMAMATVSFGAGFQIPEQGAASIAMGMGGIGKADDLSAIYQNPAGLTLSRGTQVYGNLAGIAPTATYTRTGYDSIDTEDSLIPVPSFVISSDFGGRLEDIVLAFGVNAQFGLRSEYDDLGPQRYISTNISLVTVYVGPYAAWQITPTFSIGAGIQYVHASSEIGQKANYGGALYQMAAAQNPAAADPSWNENPALDGDIDITDATDDSVAGNLGLMWKPSDVLQLGLTWRSGVEFDLEGDVDLDIPAMLTQMSGGVFQSLTTKAKTTLSLPQTIGAGLSYRPTEQLTLTTDINWNNWSVYEDIDFEFEDNTMYLPDSPNPRDWEDTWTFRLGGEYMIRENIALRAGYLFDQSPIPDKSVGPELPTSDRHGITIGVGYEWENVTLDLAYAHLFIDDRTVTDSIRDPEPVGDYEAAANIIAASVGFVF
ncbi:hypothetical protein CSA56_02200 [candidate division KSB3 bacterium]|uniref:Aromatic hydrocarbon degradation protein n=1 Tax=candidate division KSB3 bacterium TaxID=2044937 RepID=A0A2G6KJP0_9BACT|nr:MAG: hypothetical protein CSA56_02200 [candidate division KSB3 bacterium]